MDDKTLIAAAVLFFIGLIIFIIWYVLYSEKPKNDTIERTGDIYIKKSNKNFNNIEDSKHYANETLNSTNNKRNLKQKSLELDGFNYCSRYGIKCPYALSSNSPIPCVESQSGCNQVRQILSGLDSFIFKII